MIPLPVVLKWRSEVNWYLNEQVEQDLIISKVLIDIFNHEALKNKVAFRGGTALNKLIFSKPLRYSEDIDLNRLEKGPAGDLIEMFKDVLKKTFKEAPRLKQTQMSLKFINKFLSVSGNMKKLKIEINLRETSPLKDLDKIKYEMESDFFKGSAMIKVFNLEEMLGTKMRALYQRRKGRDLFDLYMMRHREVKWKEVVKNFNYLNTGATKELFVKNLKEKMAKKDFKNDMDSLLPSDVEYDYDIYKACDWFISEVLSLL